MGDVEYFVLQKSLAKLICRGTLKLCDFKASAGNPIRKVAPIQAAMVVSAETPEPFHAVRNG